jgi:hypothetical protein
MFQSQASPQIPQDYRVTLRHGEALRTVAVLAPDSYQAVLEARRMAGGAWRVVSIAFPDDWA